MKKIGFIGAYDKTDFILYVAKILVEMGRSVLIVDGTLTQKAKYIVPSISPSKTYVTQFEGIDIAVGFKNFENIKEYLGIPQERNLEYDISLIDIDMADKVESFGIATFDKNYFVTSFDMYSIKKGLEAISGLRTPIYATKILFTKEMLKEEDEYLNFLSLGSKIIWNEERIYLPFEVGDQTIIYNNQRVSKIKFKRLSVQYKEGLIYVSGQILENENINQIRKVFKTIEKGV